MKKNQTGDIYESWEDQPANLSHAQRADPICHLCFTAKSELLYKMRYRLSTLLEIAMYSSILKDDSPEQKGDWVLFIDEMTDLLELASLIDDLIRTNQLVYSYSFNKNK